MQIDDRVGDAIERAIGAHHRRRLRRLGWAHALDGQGPAWARGDPPPRSGNAVDRFDTNDHPARGELGWHDAAVRLEGPVVADVTEHFAFRWREVTGEAVAPPPPPRPAGGP